MDDGFNVKLVTKQLLQNVAASNSELHTINTMQTKYTVFVQQRKYEIENHFKYFVIQERTRSCRMLIVEVYVIGTSKAIWC